MSIGERIPLAEAERIAAELLAILAPYCKRIEVAGSVRRRAETVGDIEIVAETTLLDAPDLFGQIVARRDLLSEALDAYADAGVLARAEPPCWGPRHKAFLFGSLMVDLYEALPPAQFGLLLAIRTGPAAFSRLLVTPRWQGGMMPSSLRAHDGALWVGQTMLATPEERDVFLVMGLAWVEPWERAWPLGSRA